MNSLPEIGERATRELADHVGKKLLSFGNVSLADSHWRCVSIPTYVMKYF